MLYLDFLNLFLYVLPHVQFVQTECADARLIHLATCIASVSAVLELGCAQISSSVFFGKP
jgi:hypothetical protein